jgi:hypothetical protein
MSLNNNKNIDKFTLSGGKRVVSAPGWRPTWFYQKPQAMAFLLKLGIFIFLAGWSYLGIWMLLKYDELFGLHPDDPAESSGARALNVTQVSVVWVGVFAMTLYFLIR